MLVEENLFYGGIVGRNNYYTSSGIDEDNEIYETSGKETLSPWVEDTGSINEGYPILKWQLEM